MMPQPIKLEIAPEVLTTLVHTIDFDIPEHKDRKMRHYLSLLAHVVLKLAKKEISKRGTAKPLSIKLEYFEANTLAQTLMACLKKVPDRKLQNIFDQLDQKLS